MDFHCRGNQGLSSPDGTAIIVKFTKIHDLDDYIIQVYMKTCNILVRYVYLANRQTISPFFILFNTRQLTLVLKDLHTVIYIILFSFPLCSKFSFHYVQDIVFSFTLPLNKLLREISAILKLENFMNFPIALKITF